VRPPGTRRKPGWRPHAGSHGSPASAVLEPGWPRTCCSRRGGRSAPLGLHRSLPMYSKTVPPLVWRERNAANAASFNSGRSGISLPRKRTRYGAHGFRRHRRMPWRTPDATPAGGHTSCPTSTARPDSAGPALASWSRPALTLTRPQLAGVEQKTREPRVAGFPFFGLRGVVKCPSEKSLPE
jgi:hypothetical protein